MSLLRQRRFLPYFCTQFLGAFNDNVFKNALVTIFTFHLVVNNVNMLVNLAAGIFILPFFLFSPLAGQIADKYEKSRLIRFIKSAEIVIMLLGAAALASQSAWLLLLVLFLMGTQSAFFGPIKYSILPQHLSRDELLGGNALVEAGTFLAILLGTILGGVLAAQPEYVWPVSIAIIFFALLGRGVSGFIPAAAAAQPTLKVDPLPWSAGKDIFVALRSNRSNFLTVVAISWFWFVGATFLAQFPNFAKEVLSGNAYVATLLMAMFSIGIGLGSYICNKLSAGRVEIGLVPIGALGITLSGLYVGLLDIPTADAVRSIGQVLTDWAAVKALLGLLMLAIFGGLFIVPLYAFLQTNTPTEYRSRNIAANNIMNALFMIIAALFAILCFYFGHTIQSLFAVVAIMNAVVAIYIFVRVPEFTMRLLAWLLIHSLYRIGKHDLHHIPREGPALLVCNHVSFVDPIILGAVCSRPARFVMYHKIYHLPLANFIFRTAKAIPIAPAKEDPELLEQAYDAIAEALENGELVCIFPEGGLTPDGDIQPFKPGIDRILKRTPVPVVPMALQGLWGTWFSRKGGRAMKGFPRNWLKRVNVLSAAVIDQQPIDRDYVQQRVSELRGDQV